MPSPEDLPTREAGSAVIQPLGSVGMDDTDPTPTTGLHVNAIGPAVYAPARAVPYLESAKRGQTIEESPIQDAEAIAYAETIFPGLNFSFLGSGRYGIVLTDSEGRAFKVYRSPCHYSRYEQEAAALQLFSDAGLAPRLHLFVDAGEQYRIDARATERTRRGFGDTQIPRQNSDGQLPVMVMDVVDRAPLTEAEPTALADAFCRATELCLKYGIVSDEAEMVMDRRTGQVVFLDFSELSQETFDATHATPAARKEHETKILHGLIRDLYEVGLNRVEDQIQVAYQENGLEGARQFITDYLQHHREG